MHPIVVFRLCMQSEVFLLLLVFYSCCTEMSCQYDAVTTMLTCQRCLVSQLKKHFLQCFSKMLTCAVDILSPFLQKSYFFKGCPAAQSHFFIYLLHGQFWGDSRLFLNTVIDGFLVLTFSDNSSHICCNCSFGPHKFFCFVLFCL